jgi:protein-disulfide isomerase
MPDSMKRYLPFAIIAFVFLVAVGAGTSLYFWKERATEKTPALSALSTDSSSNELEPRAGAEPAHVRGAANARVKIEEFGDFQCPSCAALSPALNQAEQKQRGKLCLIFRHSPLVNHEHAHAAAAAAEAAGLQGRFWEMHDLLYGSQLIWTRASEVQEIFSQLAKSLELDVKRFKTDMESEEVTARINADQQRAVSLGVNRTPAIFINGERLPDSSLNQKSLEEAINKAVNRL